MIGLTTKEASINSSPGPDLTFNDYVESLQPVIAELQDKGVNKIVLLSHIGYADDQTLAAAIDGVDVIVGGHSHTLLSNTDEAASGPYPTVVKSPSGDPVLIVSAEAYGKYLGELDVTFDDAGVPVKWDGAPILLDASIAAGSGGAGAGEDAGHAGRSAARRGDRQHDDRPGRRTLLVPL